MAAKKDERRFELNGEVVEINVNSLTFGEIEFVESYFDKSIAGVDFESARGLMALTAISRTRQNPEGTTYYAELASLRDIKVETLKREPTKRPTKKAPEKDGSQS